jgi:NADH dehydrogenase
MISAQSSSSPDQKIRIVVLGGGFAGYYALNELERELGGNPAVEITLVSRENYILFTPMLHEVAASDLDPSHIAIPLHELIRRATFVPGEVISIDLVTKTVTIRHTAGAALQRLGYDYLIIALGSESNIKHLPGLSERAITMKSLEDAMYLRNHMVQQLEAAEFDDSGFGRGTLTFVVVGGGLSGVETVAAMMDFLQDATKFYPHVEREMIRVVLVHSREQLLPELGSDLGSYAEEKLQQRGVEVLLSARLVGFDGDDVQIRRGGSIIRFPARTLIWTAGIQPAAVLQSLPCKQVDGRLLTQPTLELRDWPGVYVVGDCAAVPNPRSVTKFYGPTAQNGMRQGRLAARNIAASIRASRQKPFRWHELGYLASLGQRRAVAKILGIQFSGFVAWWLWRTIYLLKLPGIHQKVRVGLDWFLDLFFPKNLLGYRLSRVLELYQAHGIPRKEVTQTSTSPSPSSGSNL